jgi:hypothetical protein
MLLLADGELLTWRQAGVMTSDFIRSSAFTSVIFLPLKSVYEKPRDFAPFLCHHFARRPFSIASRAFALSNVGFGIAIFPLARLL